MTTHVLHWFLTEPHWLAAQGLIQNLSGAFMVWGGLMMWHHSCDAHLWCWRPGKHRVAGTTWSTCSNHTREHDAMFARHAEKHPDR